jgi:hypothetical protein
VGRIANLEQSVAEVLDTQGQALRGGTLENQMALSTLIQRLNARAVSLEDGVKETNNLALYNDDEDVAVRLGQTVLLTYADMIGA